MVNLTANTVVFNKDGIELETAICAALQTAVDAVLQTYGYQDLNLDLVTTKTHIQAAFAKFVVQRVLIANPRELNREYVSTVFDAYGMKTGQLTEAQFARVMACAASGPLAYKASYAKSIRPGLGLFLLALHSSGAITLPASFSWPSVRQEGTSWSLRREVGGLVCSELLGFIRRLDSRTDVLPHDAFKAVGGDRKRKEWFLTYATKLLLATGWQRPEDVNITDLLAIKASEKEIGSGEALPLAFKALLDVLRHAYGDRVSLTTEEWAAALRNQLGSRSRITTPRALKQLGKAAPRSDHELLDELLDIEAAWGLPERLKTLSKLPGLEVDLTSMTERWLQLEELYIDKTPRESYKPIRTAFSWWNVYLFHYLPYWFARNPDTSLKFPATPSLLLTSIFVSRLVPLDTEVPFTFIEFMNAHSEHRGWTNNGYYGTLLQLGEFFKFIERYSEELPGCEGFRQPLGKHDNPRTSRPKATSKRPVPRRLFSVYLDYHEALIAHHHAVTERVLAGKLNFDDKRRLVANKEVVDTFATASIVGFVPVLFTKTKTIPLQFIPNVLDFAFRKLKDGRTVEIPHPHGLLQNLVALHTGIRHNHLQWLDRDRFDEEVDEDSTDFALLFVNTDKKKLEPWTPHVSMRVIELLRSQREWADLLDEPGFNTKHYYNNNAKTKWPKFRPLFAHLKDGRPHTDNHYYNVWQQVLCGLQGLVSELKEYGRVKPLLHLLPPSLRANDADLATKLAEYGKRFGAGESCPLNIMSDITPHSARVAVVSQYFTFLPTDLIGKFITGQSPGVVAYYVHLDKEALEAEQVHQAAKLREQAMRGAFEPVMSGNAAGSSFIHADHVNSNLVRSLRTNLEETLVSYGCISIAFTEKSVHGIDILRETRAENAVANKTEICPYGNSCPSEIIRELRGMRRCSLCAYAVRSIDHLPAVVAMKHQQAEMLDDLERRLSADASTLSSKYTAEELDRLEEERTRLGVEVAGWKLNEEVLGLALQRIARGQDTRRWVVQRPEIIERDLTRVVAPSSMTAYVLSRLGECIAYPTLESPQIRARFDLLRRELLARAGNLRDAFSNEVPIDPAAECAGLLRSVVAANRISPAQLVELLEQDSHLRNLPSTSLQLLGNEGEAQ